MTNLMIQAFTLLSLASGLLGQLEKTPNVSPELRNQVETIATYSIGFATEAIRQQTEQVALSQGTVEVAPVLATESSVNPSSPVCTLTATKYLDPIGNTVAKVEWESTYPYGTLYHNAGHYQFGEPTWDYHYDIKTLTGNRRGLRTGGVNEHNGIMVNDTRFKAVFPGFECYTDI